MTLKDVTNKGVASSSQTLTVNPAPLALVETYSSTTAGITDTATIFKASIMQPATIALMDFDDSTQDIPNSVIAPHKLSTGDAKLATALTPYSNKLDEPDSDPDKPEL